MPATPPGTTLKVQFISKAAESKRKKPFDESLIEEEYDVEHNSGVAYNMKRLTIKNEERGKQPGQNDGEGKTTPAEAFKNKGNGNKWQKQQPKGKPMKKEPAFPMYNCRVIELANSPGDICIAVKIAVGRKPCGSICKVPHTYHMKHEMLQDLLLGDDIYTGKDLLAQSVQDDQFSRMKDVEKQAFIDFRDASSATLGFTLLRIKTLLTVPSNTAAQECMRKLVGHLKTLYDVYPESEEWFKVVYLQTESATRRDVSEQDEIDAETVSNMVADGEQRTEDAKLEKYKLWNHIVQAYKNDASDKTIHPADGRKKNAHIWLSRRSQIKAGNNIGSKEQKIFIELTNAMTKRIFEGSAIRIVVCTSNTSALLEEYKWTPWAVLIDETSAGREPDCYVPLGFKPRRIVLAGDLEKVKLFTRSAGHNEFADQLGLSLYERLYGKPTMPLYRLIIKYFMHPDIAELPANLTYEWLESDDSTVVPSDEFKFFEDWWYSEPAKIYRDNRRKPAFGLDIDESRIHRMYFNVKNGESASKHGSSSQLNHANINAIADMVMSIMKHQPTCGLAPLPFDKISIFTQYKVENMELVNQVKMGIRHIGFLKEWNRMNVALTHARAQSTLIMFGNLDLWRSQLPGLLKGMRYKKLGLFIMDLLDYGENIDIDVDNTVPASLEELPDHKTWSKTMISVPAVNSKILKAFYAIKCEEHGKAQRENFRLGEAIEAPLRVQRDGGMDGDGEEVDSDDDDEAPEVKDKDGDLDMDASRMLTEVELAEMDQAVTESVY
ncbi:hypothetical protein BPOR_1540g00010 [Botrytis porri]|uniref:DNA2/NAM7 helicase-like C-terminal domain-containing protein n=1 Tax=Botrytis porri TaxID=87229 RepID=A0A4Z1K5I5_9HELO|nr:hypothetical protein BPOR_1540g00010 [Botrytis porri]